MTRSLVVTTWFPDRDHPARTPFCLAHVQALRASGVGVEVVHVQLGSTSPPAEDRYEGVHVTRVGLSPRRPRSWFSTWHVIHRKLLSAEVLHTMAFSSVLVAVPVWLTRRRPWVHTEHWNGVVRPQAVSGWWRHLAFLRYALRLPHAVTGVTEELAHEMERFSRPAATSVVPCVVPRTSEIASFPERDPLRLVGVALVNERKNPLLAVDTIGWLREHGVDARYEWVGDGPLLSQARERVVALDLQDWVSFSGSVEPSHVRGKLDAAHLFFVPSSQENFFTAAAEAIVAGRLAVVPRAGGFVDYCTPANSVIVDSWEVASLGEAILLGRQRLDETSPAEVAATVADRFSAKGVAGDFLTIYNRVSTPHA